MAEQNLFDNPAEKLKAENLLRVLENREQMRDWFRGYFNIEVTSDTIDPDSNSNPLDAMWTIYSAVRDGKLDEIDGFIMLSAREAYKTLSAGMLEVILMLHFQITISHMAAILKQSDKAVSYITSFLNKLKPYLTYNGWKQISESKTLLEFETPQGNRPYILVVICSMAGANGPHTNLIFVDEVDVVRDPAAYEEAKLIAPVSIKLSTRKFAFGLMQKELDEAKDTDSMVLRWNIMDITEKCQKSRHKPNADGSRIEAYVSKKLPLSTITPEEFAKVPVQEQNDYESVMAHPGCLNCKLLPVCKTRLADKPDTSVGNLYKSIPSTLKAFKKVSPDMAEAQLMCWKPSSKGLVYPRFDSIKNVITLEKAYEMVTGEESKEVTMEQLVAALHKYEAKIYAGVDWGYTHEATIVVMAVLPTGFSFILDTFGSPGLEVHDFKVIALDYQEKYGIMRWWCDQAAPGNIKTFSKAGLISPEFTKDILAGIEAIRSQIVDTMGLRKLFVINTENNQKILQGFKVHHFKFDQAGRITKIPDDEEFADVMDALRYIGQNVHGKSKSKVVIASNEPDKAPVATSPGEAIRQEIMKRVAEPDGSTDNSKKKKGSLVWDI